MKVRILVGVVITAMVSTGCSRQQPVEPAGAAVAAGDQRAKPAPASPGTYDLSFWHRGIPVETLVVGQPVLLKATVSDADGPARAGTVTFQYCSRPGPTQDINRVDEAPSAECDAGSAKWATLQSVEVNEFGIAFGGMSGAPQIPRSIGFRFLYRGKNSGVASGRSAHLDFTWTAAQ